MTSEPRADVAALPYLTSAGDAVPGEVRARDEDFRVEEVPAYAPSGEGDHLYVRFEKTGLDTREAVRRIARTLEVDPREAGYAGMKDRHAITVQWASFLFADPAKLEGASVDGVRVLAHARHRNKLRTGHLEGNRFDLLVRGAPAEALPAVSARLAELERRGAPNYFGGQRFGHEGSNLSAARRWLLEGGRAPRKPFERKLLVSTLQSAVFNQLLGDRVAEGTMDGAIEGDLMRKEDTGGLFVSEDLEADRERAARFEISATGPMIGSRMRWPEAEAKRREEACATAWGLDEAVLSRFRAAGAGTRRPYRVAVRGAEALLDEGGIRLRFELPSGAYATVILRELLRRTVD